MKFHGATLKGDGMRLNNGPLGSAETSLIIQSKVEGLSPQQVLVRDSLMKEKGLSMEDATKVVKGEVALENIVGQS